MIDNRWIRSGTTMHDYDGWEIEFQAPGRQPLIVHDEDGARRTSECLTKHGIEHQVIHITDVINRTVVTF